ncbi:MAG: hypothetical protein RDV48_15345 [Candidatus Eremiobacteraeota bacterium]|nr:hypothetical protein [Candidatus Eremiobacteraeota bacterium]
MEFLRLFFFVRDPTNDWVADGKLTPCFDGDSHTLMSVRLGEPLEKLSMFGPSENSIEAKKGELRYYSRGIIIDFDDGLTNTYIFIWDNCYFEPKFKPFKGKFLLKGKPVPLLPGIRENKVVAAFGEPYWRELCDEEATLYYEFGDIEWQVDFNSRGTLCSVIVTTPPLLADETARERAGCGLPWPPPQPRV